MSRPFVATAALASVLLNALIWFTFGVLLLSGNIPGMPDDPFVSLAMTLSALGGSLALMVLSFFLGNRNRLAFYAAILIFLAISILVFADQVGLIDWIAFGLSAIPFVLLILARKWFLADKSTTRS